MPRRTPPRIAIVALLIPVLAACGDDRADTTTTSTGRSPSSGWSGATATAPDAPTVTRPTGSAPADLDITDVRDGDGATLEPGQLAVVNYIGVNWSNGVVFDASYDRSPFGFVVGQGGVIPGWDKGLIGMHVGGRRQLVIPPDLAYGERAQGDIPANETLIFVVDLLAARSRPKPAPAPGPVTDLQVTDLADGFGSRSLAAGDQALVHYTGVLAETGEEFDSSWDTGEPFQLQLGTGGVIRGWDQGLVGMKPGGRRRLVIPADLAYGSTGSPPKIGPDATLVFEVDLIAMA